MSENLWCISKSFIKMKIFIFIFSLLWGASKGFMKAFKAFIKPFGGAQRNLKLKFKFLSSSGIETGRVINKNIIQK